jgi:hypothetical protein
MGTTTQEQRGLLDGMVLSSLLGGTASAAGVAVSEESSLRNTAVLACVRILSNSTKNEDCHRYALRACKKLLERAFRGLLKVKHLY